MRIGQVLSVLFAGAVLCVAGCRSESTYTPAPRSTPVADEAAPESTVIDLQLDELDQRDVATIQENLIRVVVKGGSFERVAGELVELETYLDAGADLNAPDADGATPLMKMMELSNTTLHTDVGRGMLQRVLRLGADVNHRDHSGAYALYLYTFWNADDRFIWQAFADAGADAYLHTSSGTTAASQMKAFERRNGLEVFGVSP